MNTSFRAAAPSVQVQEGLGPLAELPGTWVGSGFNLIALPNFEGGSDFRLKLNATAESLSFTVIGAPIPNRGSAQSDISYLGLHYLQQVNDAQTHEGLHIEPGLWLNIPATTDPDQPPTLVRQASVPHGDSLLAQGSTITIQEGPVFEPVSTTPIIIPPKTIPTLGYFDPYSNPNLPPGISRAAVANPNLILEEAIQGQTITSTTVISVSTEPVGGIVNIPFIQTNANATRMESIFWVETIQNQDGSQTLQLQYSQTVILNFLGIDWPHVSVGTLLKQ
ncbi:MAG: hypothetical protein COX57_01660 [Alphaproteobacteria bacterium CG_4_10_14_0_2_um_filter_63_37]|nr:MAG: hypothetical protein AUJ55_12125 [Proteobacteria bacterium CG1_02_64_396]PJA25715.1 MAG: hypothetical protein COX57_01660 [Alphaproteobacteria bacterium CG_4_10_14_0_2_um_filter_63_37]